MDRSSTVLGLMIFVATGWVGHSATAQDASQRHRSHGSSRDRQHGSRQDGQNSSRDSQSADRQDGQSRNRPSMATPEDRERFYDTMVNRYMERIGRDYQLTDAQKPQVRAQLEQLKEQQRAYSEPRRQEFQSLREEMHQMHEGARNGGQVDPQRSKEITDRMRALWQDAPLFNTQKVTQQVEQLLPPDQVQRGRAAQQQRHQQDQNAGQQRREEMRQRWQQRQQDPAGQGQAQPPAWPGAAQPQTPSDAASAAAAPSSDGRHSHRSHRTQDGGAPQYQPTLPVEPQHAQDSSEETRGRHSHRTEDSGRRGRAVVEDPVGPWERYVRDFTRRYQLDASQQATAQSALRTLQESRTAYEQSHRADFQSAQQIPDEKQRQQRLKELNAPVADLFGQLKTKLAQIPTAAQRQAVEGSPTPAPPPAVSQQQAPAPTAAGSQPAQ